MQIDDNIDNGLITKIWGPHFWITLHSITFGYPVNPTKEQKKYYKNFFTTVSHVLPCKLCRDSYAFFINSEPTVLNDDVLVDRHTLSKWLYDLHERVNKKLGVDYDISFDYLVHKYESFRAKCKSGTNGCVMPIDLKAKSFFLDSITNFPIVPIHILSALDNYAKTRNVSFDNVDFLHKIKRDKHSQLWIDRENMCKQIGSFMKINAIPSVELDGPFKGLPTIQELHLLSLISSNLSIQELDVICSRLG